MVYYGICHHGLAEVQENENVSSTPALRVFNRLQSVPWAILPDHLEEMAEIALRLGNSDISALAKELGRPLDNTRSVSIYGDTAVIPIQGKIFRYADMFSEISGATTVQTLALDLQIALQNPAINSILLEIDSGGGEVNGIAEFAAQIREGTKKKPIFAYISDLGASAAYWIAAAATEIIASPTALVGSIGVVMGIANPEKDTGRILTFVSSQSPLKRPDPRTESGRNALQDEVDSVADVFLSAIADYRETSVAYAADNFGRGGVMISDRALATGMIDAVGFFDTALKSVQASAANKRQMRHPQYGGPMGDKEMTKSGFFKNLFAGISPEEKAEIFAEANLAANPTFQEEEPQVSMSEKEYAAQLTALREEQDKMRAELIAERANSFVRLEIASGRLTPASFDAYINLYTILATDDQKQGEFTLPSGTKASRLAVLETVQSTLTPHKMTTQQTTLTVLPDHVVGPQKHGKPENEADPATLAKMREFMGNWQLPVNGTNGNH